METKNELKEKLNELKAQIKLNSKDAHWAENALREYESLVGQIKHEPVVLDCGKEIDEWSGDTFRITKTNKGVLYHTYGGYSVFCTPNIKSLYETLCDYVDNKDEFSKLEGVEKENIELALSALTYCINLPSFICSDSELLFSIAGRVVEYLRETSDKLLNVPLKEESIEDVKLNEAYREAELGMRNLVNQVDEEVKEIKSKQ